MLSANGARQMVKDCLSGTYDNTDTVKSVLHSIENKITIAAKNGNTNVNYYHSYSSFIPDFFPKNSVFKQLKEAGYKVHELRTGDGDIKISWNKSWWRK